MLKKIGALLWTVIILVASLMPKGAIPNQALFDIRGLDKFAHFVFYFLLVLLWSFAFYPSKKRVERIIFIASILFGLGMEILQWQLNNGRHFEIPDLLANIIGSIGGLMIFYKLTK